MTVGDGKVDEGSVQSRIRRTGADLVCDCLHPLVWHSPFVDMRGQCNCIKCHTECQRTIAAQPPLAWMLLLHPAISTSLAPSTHQTQVLVIVPIRSSDICRGGGGMLHETHGVQRMIGVRSRHLSASMQYVSYNVFAYVRQVELLWALVCCRVVL
jgi:hypothetical protein